MAFPVTVMWDDATGMIQVQSGNELDILLDKITSGSDETCPVLVVVGNEGGDLTLGVGASVSTLNHVLPSCDPPYLICVGDDPLDDVVDFFLCGHHTQFARRNTIPNELARAAVREFAETGRLSEKIRWEEV